MTFDKLDQLVRFAKDKPTGVYRHKGTTILVVKNKLMAYVEENYIWTAMAGGVGTKERACTKIDDKESILVWLAERCCV